MAALGEGKEGRCQWRKCEVAMDLNKNVMFEVLRRVDPVTLATASCVNCEFRSVSEDEVLWEKLCNERWPSTKDARVKSILASVGGYRRVYAHCYPWIVNMPRQPGSAAGQDDVPESIANCSPSDFISIVDVVYGDQSMFSKIVEGFPGAADDVYGWFSTCPFRVDLLRPSEKDYHDHQGQNPIMVENILQPLTSCQSSSSVLKRGSPRDRSKFWKTLCDKMRVSWIVINTNTKQMANLASWKPLGGFRHWLCDEDFLLRFGSVLPGLVKGNGDSSRFSSGAVQCNISLVCSLKFADVGEIAKAELTLTELSLQLEDFGGALANGAESVAILHRALRCPKSRKREIMVDSYQGYLKVRNEVKAKNIRDDRRLNVAAAVSSGVSTCLFILWFLGY